MASDPNFVRGVCDQADLADRQPIHRMLGEYVIHIDARAHVLVKQHPDDRTLLRQLLLLTAPSRPAPKRARAAKG